MIPKAVPFRSQKLRDAPRDESCVMCGYALPGEVVGAHLPMVEFGGLATKCPDWMLAHLCSRPNGCHDYADSEEGRKDWMWRMLALCRTLDRLFAQGRIKVV